MLHSSSINSVVVTIRRLAVRRDANLSLSLGFKFFLVKSLLWVFGMITSCGESAGDAKLDLSLGFQIWPWSQHCINQRCTQIQLILPSSTVWSFQILFCILYLVWWYFVYFCIFNHFQLQDGASCVHQLFGHLDTSTEGEKSSEEWVHWWVLYIF